MSTGMRVRRGHQRQQPPSTGSTTPSHHGAPRSCEPAQAQVDAVGGRAGQQPAVEQQPLTGAVQRAPEATTARAGRGPRPARRPADPRPTGPGPTPGRSVNASSTTTTPTSAATSHATGVTQLTSASSSPVRQAARHRRSDSGSAKPRAAWASQGSSAAESDQGRCGPGPTHRRRPAPAAYVVAPHRISQRWRACRASRAGPRRAGTAMPPRARTGPPAPAPPTPLRPGCRRGWWPAAPSAARTAGQGRRCPGRARARRRGAASTSRASRSAPERGRGPETCPSAERAPTSIASTVTASSTATGLVRKRATSPVSSDHLVVVEPLPLRRAPRRERRRVALGGDRAASFGHVGAGLGERGRQVADGVETVPVRQPARRPAAPRAVAGSAVAAARRVRRAASISPGCATHRDVRREVVEGRRRATGSPGSPASGRTCRTPAAPPVSGQARDREFASRVNSAARRSW